MEGKVRVPFISSTFSSLFFPSSSFYYLFLPSTSQGTSGIRKGDIDRIGLLVCMLDRLHYAPYILFAGFVCPRTIHHLHRCYTFARHSSVSFGNSTPLTAIRSHQPRARRHSPHHDEATCNPKGKFPLQKTPVTWSAGTSMRW